MEALKRYEALSRDVLDVLYKARHDNGLIFTGGK
jgi:hypothetical protein